MNIKIFTVLILLTAIRPGLAQDKQKATNQALPCPPQTPSGTAAVEAFTGKVSGLVSLANQSGNTGPVTFRAILMDDTQSKEIEANLGEKCSVFLKKLYRSGQSLYSSSLLQATKPLKVAALNSGPHSSFYHYTSHPEVPKLVHEEITDRSQAHAQTLKDGGYDSILGFLRKRKSEIWDKALYVAEDNSSSSTYGNRLIELTFSPDALVLDQNKIDFKSVVTELEGKFPGLQSACSPESIHPGQTYMLIADDSGIDLIDFPGSKGGKEHSWFQVISMKKLTQTRVLK